MGIKSAKFRTWIPAFARMTEGTGMTTVKVLIIDVWRRVRVVYRNPLLRGQALIGLGSSNLPVSANNKEGQLGSCLICFICARRGDSKGTAGPRLVNLGASQACENFGLTKPKLFLGESPRLRKL